MDSSYHDLFPLAHALIGVVHLPALPGSPFHTLSMAEIRARALADAETLIFAGFDGIIVENFGDAPFQSHSVGPHTVAAMTLLVREVIDLTKRVAPERHTAVGVNVLRNDAKAALAIAKMTHASFIRVNVHTGAMVTDQGIIQGQAYETLLYRKRLNASAAIFADVMVKHAHPLGPADIRNMARDTFSRGGASALILSGSGTGQPADPERLRTVREAAPGAPILLGSGATLDSFDTFAPLTDGMIVGTALKEEGQVERPIDLERALAFHAARERWRALT